MLLPSHLSQNFILNGIYFLQAFFIIFLIARVASDHQGATKQSDTNYKSTC